MKKRRITVKRKANRTTVNQFIVSAYNDAQRMIRETTKRFGDPYFDFSLDDFEGVVREEIKINKMNKGKETSRETVARLRDKLVRDSFTNYKDGRVMLSRQQATNWKQKILELEGVNIGNVEAIMTGATDIASYIEKYSALAASKGLTISQYVFGS